MSLFEATHNTGAERQAFDFYATPPEPTLAFIAAEWERLNQFHLIWEPACGDGAIAKLLEAHGLPVIATDVVDRGYGEVKSFYEHWFTMAAAIVTNPPFSDCNDRGKHRWFRKARELEIDYMALLLPAQWAHAAARVGLFEDWRPAREWRVCWRIDWSGGGQSPGDHSWYVWDSAAPKSDTWACGQLSRRDPNQMSLFEAVA